MQGYLIEGLDYEKMNNYLESRHRENTSVDKEPYDIVSNNCLTFSMDVAIAGGASLPQLSELNPLPSAPRPLMSIAYKPVYYEPATDAGGYGHVASMEPVLPLLLWLGMKAVTEWEQSK